MTVDVDALEALVRDAMATHGVPGVGIAVTVDGRDHLAGFGITNVDHPLPVTPHTIFQIGSTTKTMVATVIMMLVEEGVLDLDVPVRNWLPALRLADPEVAEQVTLRHLLTHTAGFQGDDFTDFGPGDDVLARAVAAMVDLEQVTPLGRVWNYCNAGFNLAGRVVEVVREQTLEQAIKEMLLDPLGMTTSTFFASEAIVHSVAVGHVIGDDGARVVRPFQLPRAVNAAGGLMSSAADQLAYAKFQIGDGTTPDGRRLLQEKTLREMQSPQVEAGGGRAAHCGISWLIQRTPGLLAHGGSTRGQESAFVIVPDRGFAITVLTNADRGALLQRDIAKWALRNLAGVHSSRPDLAAARAGSLAAHHGTYRARMQDIVVTSEDDELVLEIRPTAEGRATLGLTEVILARATLFEGGGVKILDGALKGQFGEFLYDGATPRWLRILGRVQVRPS